MRTRPLATRVAAVMGATILLASLFAGTTLAKPPAFGGSASPTPTFVTYGQLVRFDVTWTNLSGANLPTVFMKAVTPDDPDLSAADDAALVALVAESRAGTCAATVPTELNCAFGAVNAGQSVSFAAVYRTPISGTNPFSIKFNFTAQGNTPSDPQHSRGDDMPLFGQVTLVTASDDRAGSYIFGSTDTIETNPLLNKRRNPQSTKLDFAGSTEDNFGATVSESATTACPPGITTCYGQLVIMNVKSGQQIGGGFLATSGYVSVPGGATGTFIHWLHPDATGSEEGVDYEIVDQSCDDAPAGTSCIDDVFKTNGNTFYVLRFFSNGPYRGA